MYELIIDNVLLIEPIVYLGGGHHFRKRVSDIPCRGKMSSLSVLSLGFIKLAFSVALRTWQFACNIVHSCNVAVNDLARYTSMGLRLQPF